LASARTGNELHRGSANTGMGTGRCPILELNRARTGVGTVFCADGTMALDQPQRGEDDQHRHQQTTIKKHWNGGAPSVLEDGSGVVGRRQKRKAVRCGHDDSLTWQCRGGDGAGSAPARQGRSASILINNNQQVKQSWVVDNTTSDERRQPIIRQEGK